MSMPPFDEIEDITRHAHEQQRRQKGRGIKGVGVKRGLQSGTWSSLVSLFASLRSRMGHIHRSLGDFMGYHPQPPKTIYQLTQPETPRPKTASVAIYVD